MPNPFARAAQVSGPRAVGGPRASMWSGADSGRLNADWTPWTYSADYEAKYYLRFLRARARELVRNNPHAAGFMKSLADNIVGPDGIMLQAKNTAGDGRTLLRSVNQEIERGWKAWGEPEICSADGRLSWVDFQRLFVTTLAMDGEVIVRRLRGFDNAFGYALQFIDADLLDETYNVGAMPNGNEIRMGVEIDPYNRPVAYHFWSRYLLDGSGRTRERTRIAAEEIIHCFAQYRANQTRGVTWFAPALTRMHQIDGYAVSELVAARTSAAKMGWIVNKSAEAIQAYTAPAAGEKLRIMDVEPGLISELKPGQEFQQFDPTHPSTTFDAFEGAALRAVSRAFNVSVLTFTGDLRNANFSSMRAGLLPERDGYRCVQGFIATHCHRIVFRDWLSMALLADAISLDARVSSDYRTVVWKGRGWKWVSPVDDLKAAKLEIDLGLNSRTHLAAEQGRDFEETVDELADEQDYAAEQDVDVSGNQISGVNPTSVSPEGNADETNQDGSGAGDGAPGSGDSNSSNAAAPRLGRRLRALSGGRR